MPRLAQIMRPSHHPVNERFVGFAFAGADLVVDIRSDGVVAYAAGAFPSIFGRQPEAVVGRPVRELVAPVDHNALDAALALLGCAAGCRR